jgi:hypothetical protein
MDEHEQRPASTSLSPESLDAALRALCSPYLDHGTRWTCDRLRFCEFMKVVERQGKSSVIDSFTRSGLSLGAHRAKDRLHDPVVGFYLAAKEMGFTEACRRWPRHMASDVVTPMSLPLPGTFLLKNDSWVVQLYSKGLLNLRTGVITPLIGFALTEAETRFRHRKESDDEIVDLALQEAHLMAALIGGSAGLLLTLALPETTAALIVALLASAAWHGVAAGCYWLKRHRVEIKSATGALVRYLRDSSRSLGATLATIRLPSMSVEVEDEASVAAKTPSAIALTAAAAAMVLILSFGGSKP